MTSAVLAADRLAWLLAMRRADERQEDALAPEYDVRWGQIGETHRDFVAKLLSRLPPGGRVLDAPCGTGNYFRLALDAGRRPLGFDHSGGALAVANAKYPEVPTAKHDLQDLPFREEFDGVICVDAMEFVPPEEWPGVLARFRWALRPGGWLYLTIELVREEDLRKANEAARRSGLPVVAREVIWDEPDGYYHHYPTLRQVRAWLAAAGFAIEEEREGPWHEEGYAYHHLLARLAALPQA
jgi:SAM-dependent methyltransferase